jgi:hypothetical protein
MRITKFIITIFILLASILANAQNPSPLLDRKISVDFNNMPLKDALFEIAKQAQFNISYNSNLIPANSMVNFQCEQKKISEILVKILPSEITFKNSGNSLVLLKKASVEKTKKSEIIITGYVFDSIKKIPISGATALDVYGSQSVLTDSSGNFRLQLSYKQQDLVLSVSKAGYKDTLILLKPISQKIVVQLHQVKTSEAIQPIKIEALPLKLIESYPISRLMIPEQIVINSKNILGYSKRKFQFSLTPGTSTNLKIAGTVKNEVSINLIGGYSYGVGKFELGGAFNINRAEVSGVQIAGFSNLVGGELRGLQIAGALNRTKGSQIGVQIAGFGNFNTENFDGFQLSGGVNLAKNVLGWQLAGGVNIADSLSGVQISPAFNKSNQLKGLQLSAGVNVCETLSGVQIGLFNRAKQNNGLQIGIINFNNSSKGLSIGILNFVKGKKFPRILFAYR